MSPTGSLGWLLALEPTPDDARTWLARELREARYQESLAERFSRWLDELLDSLGRATQASGGLGLVVAIVLVVVLAALLALALSRLSRGGGGERTSASVFAATRRTALEHRRAAETALADGRHDEVVLEAVRALSAGLVERGLLTDTVGLTVLETTAVAAARFPRHGEELQQLRVRFEDTRYGDRHADEVAARRSLAVEAQVAAAEPTDRGVVPTHAAVPS